MDGGAGEARAGGGERFPYRRRRPTPEEETAHDDARAP
jgi:hypothetical protein